MKKSSGSLDLIAVLEPYFTKKAPFQLPETVRKFIVQWMPWVNLVIGILLLPAVLVVLGLGSYVGSLAVATGQSVGISYWLSTIVMLVMIALLFVTFPGLRAKNLIAWKLVFWAALAHFIYNLVSAISNPFILGMTLVYGLLGLVVELYILFQVKHHYK